MSMNKVLGASFTLGVVLMLAHLVLGSGSRALGSGMEQGGITLSLVPFVSGLSQPLLLTHGGDGSNRLYVLEKPGRIRLVVGGSLQSTPFLNLTSLVLSSGSEQGLLGLAFHPSYATNGYLYVNYIDLNGNTVVARYTAAADRTTADPSSAHIVLQVTQPFANHNGGMLAFGRDGYLYIGLGDGGSGGDPNNNGQNGGTLLGKILRLDVNSTTPPYVVPPTNPFVGNAAYRPEIWALGLRNPWRFSFDRSTGDLFIGDVGQGAYEEVDRQPAASPGGENYGWRIMEGFHCYNAATCNQSGLTLPILEYDHSQGNCSITGGYLYRGAAMPGLVSAYVYGDYCTGRIWAARPGSGNLWTTTLLLDSPYSISSFGEDQAGELYLTDLAGGVVYRLVESATGATPTATTTPITTPTTTPILTPTTTSTPITTVTRVGQAIRTTGGVIGQWIKTGSGSYTFNSTGPANTQPNSSPSITLMTTIGAVTNLCSAVGASPPFTTTCTGTTSGDLSPSAPVTVSFPLVGGGVSPSTGNPTSIVLLGDINLDNLVDIRDYALWRQAFGQANCGNVADLNLDTLVDIRDYGLWRQWFGNSGAAGSR